MLRFIFSLLFLSLSFPVIGCYSEEPALQTKKQAEADLNTWDFGQVRNKEVLKHNFSLKNESKTVLNIKDINTSCGCTVSKVDKKKLAPGEAATIEVQFKPEGEPGKRQQFVYVHTDSLDTPIIRYIIKAEVVK